MDETVTSEFFRSVAGRFAENGPRGPGAIGLLVLAGAVLGFVLAGFLRRLLARRAALSSFVAHHGLSAADLDLVRRLAADAGATPLDVLTHLDLFERTTHRALGAAPPGSPGRRPATARRQPSRSGPRGLHPRRARSSRKKASSAA
jgi:hypothetical protein